MQKFLRASLRPLCGVFAFTFIILCGCLYWTTPFPASSKNIHIPDNINNNSPSTSVASRTPTNYDHDFPPPPTSLPTPFAKRTDVGKLPALGWNSWNAYRCNITEERILAAARSIVDLGLREVGYKYVNIDDCWSMLDRADSDNRLIPDADKFPKGIRYVADEVHRLGLKLGIYSDAGSLTCAKYPGSLEYEDLDAETWEEWGVDYLKYDNCNIPDDWKDMLEGYVDWRASRSYERFARMGRALGALKRPLEYNLCIWGTAKVWSWGNEVGHSWRMGNDSTPDWKFLGEAIRHNAKYLEYVDFWAHNDMDMMEIGNGKKGDYAGLSTEEEKTHFATWAFMKSPILLGTELGGLSTEQVEIVKNQMLLEFNQDDIFGRPAMPFASVYGNVTLPDLKGGANFTIEQPPVFFSGKSSNGVGVFAINWKDDPENMAVVFGEVPELIDAGEPKANESIQAGFEYEVTDMWTGEVRGKFKGNYVAEVASHGTLAILVRRTGV